MVLHHSPSLVHARDFSQRPIDQPVNRRELAHFQKLLCSSVVAPWRASHFRSLHTSWWRWLHGQQERKRGHLELTAVFMKVLVSGGLFGRFSIGLAGLSSSSRHFLLSIVPVHN